MDYYTKKYKDTKFPNLVIKQVLNTFINMYKEGNVYLTLSKNNHVQSYENLDIFLTDYNQHNFITNIEYIIFGITRLKIEFNMYHTTIYVLNSAKLDFNRIIQPLENYCKHELNSDVFFKGLL
ncbi:hypothetical protein CN602_04190 [Bacillus cereus]|nr:hypothetical protein CN602_04190 [Bacillus cereus]